MATKNEAIKLLATRLLNSKNPVLLSGAGISAESDIPTFRGQGGFWKRWRATDLATGCFSVFFSFLNNFYFCNKSGFNDNFF